MLYRLLALNLFAFAYLGEAIHYSSSTKFLPKREPCTPLAQGWEMVDDTPAINAAILACGNGGTIILPADQIYSIRTPIDFTPCKNCDFQIEGTLIAARGQWDYWNQGNVPSIWKMDGVKGVRIRSVTGSGLVDGNAIDYYTGRWDSGMSTTKAFADIKNGSSNVVVENLTLKNVMHRFFRAQGGSTNITFSNLKLSMEQQWGAYPRNEYDAAGIELGQVTNVKISNIDMNFQSRPSHRGPVGICIAMDIGTHNVDARDVNCTGAWGGALVTLNSIGSIIMTGADLADTVSNIYISDFIFNGSGTATGFKSAWMNSTMKNITWDGVKIIDGNPASAGLCWLKSHSYTAYPVLCQQQLSSTITDIWFKRFRGKISGVPSGSEWGKINNMTVPEYHFEDWQNTTV